MAVHSVARKNPRAFTRKSNSPPFELAAGFEPYKGGH
jgi:hypothetical protein